MAERARAAAAPVSESRATAPPHDPDAEAAVLSAVMLSQALLDQVRDIVEPIDFFMAQHRLLYEALLAIDDAGGKLDVVTIAHHLRAGGRFQSIGGSAFLAEIYDATPSVANAVEHARIIRRFGVLRRMGSVLRELAAVAMAPETRANVDGFLQRCEAEVFTANVTTTTRETSSSLRSMMESAAVDLDPMKPREPRGMSTGLVDLDELTHGMMPGELWYVAGRPGMGKTALALGIAASMGESGRHAAVFSMEMKREELSDRMLSSHSGVQHAALQKRTLSQDQWAKVVPSIEALSRLPLVFDDTTDLTPSRLRSRLRRHASELRANHPGKLALVVVDYVQLMGWDQPNNNRNDELERISRALKIMAGEFGVTMLALAQLKRPHDARADKRPGLTDLRGSGALEQDADKVLFVHRDEAEGAERGEAELILAKGRNAPQGRITVGWQPWCVRFTQAHQAGFEWGPPEYD